MLDIFHNSHDLFYRSPFGAVECGSSINIKIKINKTYNIEELNLNVSNDDGDKTEVGMKLETTEGDFNIYTCNINIREITGLLWYYFSIKKDGNTYYYGNNKNSLGGIGEIYISIPPSYQITVYKKQNNTPNWFKDAIIYQIFPDRFYNGNEDEKLLKPSRDMIVRSNWNDTPSYIRDNKGRVIYFDYFGGNLLGIIKKLDYLKELGVNIIYLNPIFDAASNHKYDTGDYKKIDQMFGDEETFTELCKTAEEKGISIILDGVFSHTGSDSIYFNKENRYNSLGAYQSKESEYYSWYRFEEYPNKYESWWGVDVLPNVNELDIGYQNYIINNDDSVLNKWMNCGIKGWRLDVADELPAEFIKNFKGKLREINNESILIGEVWEDASNKISYGERREYLLGDELDSVMNYPFRDIFINFIMGNVDSYDVHSKIMSLYENYPTHHFYSMMNLVGTHDSPRILTILGESPNEHDISQEEKERFKLNTENRKLAISRLKLITLVQMTFPGVPSIYYGDEVGVEGYTDPLNRRTYPWGNEDKEILDWYKKITSLRNNNDIFKTGNFKSLSLNKDVYGYIREIKNSTDIFGQKKEDNLSIILINRSKEEVEVNIDVRDYKIENMNSILDDKNISNISENICVNVPPLESIILLKV